MGLGVSRRISATSACAASTLKKASTTSTPSSPMTKPALEPALCSGPSIAAYTPSPTCLRRKGGFAGDSAWAEAGEPSAKAARAKNNRFIRHRSVCCGNVPWRVILSASSVPKGQTASETGQEVVDCFDRLELVEFGRVADAGDYGKLHLRCYFLHFCCRRRSQEVALGSSDDQQWFLREYCKEGPEVDVRRRPACLERLGDRHVVVEADFAIVLSAVALRHLHPVLAGVAVERATVIGSDGVRSLVPALEAGILAD